MHSSTSRQRLDSSRIRSAAKSDHPRTICRLLSRRHLPRGRYYPIACAIGLFYDAASSVSSAAVTVTPVAELDDDELDDDELDDDDDEELEETGSSAAG